MTATTTTFVLALAAILMAIPVSASEGTSGGSDDAWPPCEVFQYGLAPPGYQVRPECIGPDLDNTS
jgi:hypothetical protein